MYRKHFTAKIVAILKPNIGRRIAANLFFSLSTFSVAAKVGAKYREKLF